MDTPLCQLIPPPPTHWSMFPSLLVTLDHKTSLKGIVHPKMKILSSFTHPQVVPNLYEFLCSAEHKGRYSEECGKQSSSVAPLTSIVFFFYYRSQWCPKTAWLQTFFKISSAEQRNSYRFGTTWGWVNDDRIFIFGWTIPLSVNFSKLRFIHHLKAE